MRIIIKFAATIVAGFLLAGCGSINSFLAEKTADNMPTWLGGLPADAPPRPGDARYEEYERVQRERAGAIKTDPAKAEKQ